MKNGGQDDKFLCRLSSRDNRYNTSKQEGDASFRVLYYGGATGSVPFMWESQPGTPKHKLSDSPLPPLTPPPQYLQSSPLASPSLKKNINNKQHSSKMFNSIFARMASKKTSSPTSPSLSSSSYSSSYSLPSTPPPPPPPPPLYYKKARLRSTSYEYDEVGTDSPTSTLCFSAGNNDIQTSSKAYYYHPIKSLKKVVKSIAYGRRH